MLGLVTWPNGTQEIMVSSGSNNASEIFSFDSMAWRSGADFPDVTYAYKGQSLQYRDSFIAISGYVFLSAEESKYRKDIWYFDPELNQWTEFESSLEIGRDDFAAMLVPNDVCWGQ